MKWWARFGIVLAGILAGVVSVLAAEAMRPHAQVWRPDSAPDVAAPSQMPTQQCADASRPAARMLCERPELASMEMLAERLYLSQLQRMTDEAARRTVQQEHQHWQRTVRDACTTPACLGAAYKARLARFGFVTEQHGR